MENDKLTILAIETSCDETAASLVEAKDIDGDIKIDIISNIIASQIDIHKQYGGVFPEIASRAHTEKIIPVVEEAIGKNNYDVIAVTTGPGLIGSLLVGVNFAKTLAFTTGKPIIGINHWLGHIYSNFAGEKAPEFPALILIVSGGHTGLVLMKSHNEIITLGETLDDAAGEAFDKVAKLLDLPYPGGPSISRMAQCGEPFRFNFPRAMLDRKDYNFSFSGLKTAVLNESKKHTLDDKIKTDIAASFQQTVTDILIGKTLQAAEEFNPKSICLCGGVSANKELRSQMESRVNSEFPHISFHTPHLSLTTDNAAMIGIAAAYQILAANLSTSLEIKKAPNTWREINADANLKL